MHAFFLKKRKIDTKQVIQVFTNTKMSCLSAITEWLGLSSKPIAKGSVTFTNFEAAGCIFTDGEHILAGYQPKRGAKLISGFGGSRKVGENYFETAMREVIEELFEIKPSQGLLEALNLQFQPNKTLMNGPYIVLHYNLDDINILLDIVSQHYSNSPIYSDMPIGLLDLIFKRRFLKGMEVQTILLLPFVEDVIIDGNFRKDINLIKTRSTD